MWLRRIAEHVREQNWTAIVIDFAIVVMGVFIGIQVSNWNQQQNNVARQNVLLFQLVEDLHADLGELEFVIWISTLRFNAAETIVNRASGWELPDTYPNDYGKLTQLALPQRTRPDSASDALYFSQRFTVFDMELRTYSILIAGGDLSFAKRPALANQLREHYNFAEQWIRTEKTRHQSTNTELLTAFNRHGININDKIDWLTLNKLVKEDLELQGLLKRTVWLAYNQIYFLKHISTQTEQLIKQIESTNQ
ncbi:hypothetical protein HR45_03155 [Shewanella mangrovi]|uniref:Uncharacterized protein n=1 Tax=Shewanella mangrovi TaxID=1515746 RepID=A0A094LTC8_9GAMM|nr:DUF6090 family protein [Shewanella mangrovi]KFZ38448.1 hypothetical protein HR45_03155 [Shewanella mangrovi]